MRECAITWIEINSAFSCMLSCQFSYFPLVWMFHGRTMNNRINKIHEKTLRFFYKDEQIFFMVVYWKVSINQRNLQVLVTEIYTVRKDLRPGIMKDLFITLYRSHTIWEMIQFCKGIKTLTESISSLTPKTWKLVPCEIKNANSLDIYKEKIKI